MEGVRMCKEPVKHEVALASHLAVSLVRSVVYLNLGTKLKSVVSVTLRPRQPFYALDKGLGTPHVRSGFFGEGNIYVRQDFRRCLSVRSDSAGVSFWEGPATGMAAAFRHSGTIQIEMCFERAERLSCVFLQK